MTIWSKLLKLRSSLPGWTSRKCKFVFDGDLAWDDWQETKLTGGGRIVLIGGVTSACYRHESSVEREFPGFIDVCKKLEAVDCDKYMVTSVLKHLIAHKSRHQLDQRLEILGVGQKVAIALALGITGDDFVTYLEYGTKPKQTDSILPDNVFDF